MRLIIFFVKLILLYPVTFVLFLMTWLLQWIQFFLAYSVSYICKSNHGKVLTYLSTLYDEDLSKTRYPKHGIAFTLLLNGDLPFQDFKKLFQKNVLEKQFSSSNQEHRSYLRYPELRKYLSNFMGFRFWIDEENFKINDHILKAPSDWLNWGEDMLHEEILKRKFELKKSPWLCFHLANYKGEKTMLIFQFHHTMVDAISILKLLVEGLGETKLTVKESKWKPERNFKYFLTFPFQVPSVMAYFVAKTSECENHPWLRPERLPLEEQVFPRIRFTNSNFQIKTIQEIGRALGVIPSSVMFGILAGAIRQAFPGLPKFAQFVTVPKPNHPPFLANHLYIGTITLPCDEKSITERILKCNTELLKLKQSNLGMIVHDFTSLLTNPLATPLKKIVFSKAIASVPSFYSSIAGEEKGFSVGGIPCIAMKATTSTGHARGTIAFCVFSYKGNFSYAIYADNDRFTNKDVDELKRCLELEYQNVASFFKIN